jgi:hypothetical protein
LVFRTDSDDPLKIWHDGMMPIWDKPKVQPGAKPQMRTRGMWFALPAAILLWAGILALGYML